MLSILSKLSMRLNRVAGPFLLRNGLWLRHALDGGKIQDNPFLDQIFVIPWAQQVISLEIHQDIHDRRKRSESLIEQWVEKAFDSVFGEGPDHEYLHKITDSQLRLKILESYLRPVLVPNEKWSDVVRWQYHTRFLKWAREEFLFAKYRSALLDGLERYPNLRSAPQIAAAVQNRVCNRVFGDPKKDDNTLLKTSELPSAKLVIDAFGMQQWTRDKDEEGEFARMEEIAVDLGGSIAAIFGSSMRLANIPLETNVGKLSVEELLEVAGAHVASCGPLNVLCNEYDIYQLWTKEYIDGLCEHLHERVESYDGETVIVDVGAGDGLLGNLIRQKLNKKVRSEVFHSSKMPGTEIKKLKALPEVVSVDNGSWRIKPKASVEPLAVDVAIKKYACDPSKQVIVLCSWMPTDIDWTTIFRAEKVDEYILIGEYDDGNCGDNWETWGNHEFLPENYQVLDLQTDKPCPFEKDGYKRQTLEKLRSYQFSRFDSADSSNSATISFRTQR